MRTAITCLLLVVIGCGGSTSTVYTEAEFCKIVQGASADQVRAALGPPDKTDSFLRGWYWKNRVKDKKGKLIEWVGVQMTEDYNRVWVATSCN